MIVETIIASLALPDDVRERAQAWLAATVTVPYGASAGSIALAVSRAIG